MGLFGKVARSLILVASPVILIFLIIWGVRSCQIHDLRNEFPENLRMGALVAGGVNWGDGCSGAAFELDSDQVRALRSDGFIQSLALPSRYSGWQQTPVKRSWVSEGAWPGLSCIGYSETTLDIFLAVQQENGFYAVSQRMVLFLLPDIGLAVATYDDFTH